MTKLFNTPLEHGLRVLLLLDTQANPISLERIYIYDFMTCFSSIFDVSDTNLHGNEFLSFSQLPSRRTLCHEAIKTMVLNGFITAEVSEKGFVYSISTKGKTFKDSIESSYKLEYTTIASKVSHKYQSLNDLELQVLVNTKSIYYNGGEY
ncbi:ABC-three component system middle component 2 [Streptococcus suis]